MDRKFDIILRKLDSKSFDTWELFQITSIEVVAEVIEVTTTVVPDQKIQTIRPTQKPDGF